MFISGITPKGNVGHSYISQELANEQAKAMDEHGCERCVNCFNCFNCKYCISCVNCLSCEHLRDCEDCIKCMHCEYCNNCNDCHHCIECLMCFLCKFVANSQGVLAWEIKESKTFTYNISSINGLVYPVAFSDSNLQIGCKNYTLIEWEDILSKGLLVINGNNIPGVQIKQQEKDLRYILDTIKQLSILSSIYPYFTE